MRRAPALLAVAVLALLVPALFGGGVVAPGGESHLLAGPPAESHPALPSPSSDAWPTFGGNPDRAGYTLSDGPNSSYTAWEVQLSGNPGLHLRTSVAINGSLLVVADDLGDVYALNLTDSGARRWVSSVGPVPTAPSIDGDLVLFGDAYGAVTALRAVNGSVAWTRSVGAAVAGSVAVENGSVLYDTYSGLAGALRESDGVPVWSRSLGGPLTGAPAFDGTNEYVVGSNGTIYALDPSTGTPRWSASTGGLVRAGVVAADGLVFVVGFHGTVFAYGAAGTGLRWSFDEVGHARAGYSESPVAVDPTTAYLTNDAGGRYAIDVANGTLRWNSSTPYPYETGYNITEAPVITPHGLYLVDALEELDRIDPSTGAPRWSLPLATSVYASPAVVDGGLALGDDDDILQWVASPGGLTTYPVHGEVRALNGTPLSGVGLTFDPGPLVVTNASGGFEANLTVGSHTVFVDAAGFVPVHTSLTVSGPTNLTYVLVPVTLYPVAGRVLDAGSDHPLAGVRVHLFATDGSETSATTGADGSFVIQGPNGSDYLTADPPSGYEGVQSHVLVQGTGVDGVLLALPPVALVGAGSGLSAGAAVWGLPLLAVAVAGLTTGYWAAVERRRALGLGGQVLSRFGRFVVMRLLLVPVQAAILLAVLFIFGSFLPTAAKAGSTPCSLSGGWCSAGSWSDPLSVIVSFFGGWWTFIVNIATGNWGTASFGANTEPTWQYIQWWLPPSVELAIFALAISALIAYPVGLRAGWKPDGALDYGVRGASLLALLLPSFLIIILLLGFSYNGFSNALGDTPYGVLPNTQWWDAHGGNPPHWIGEGANTLPTGLPLVDGLVHGAWAFELVVLVKTLFQALVIALVYVAIFLRFARHAVVERAQSMPILAARSRGVPESTLLWRHAGREVLPVYILVFGITLPVYIGTQALAEALFSDVGLGRVLIAEMTHVAKSGFGFASTAATNSGGNLYQVTIFLLLLAVLVGSLLSDIAANYLDPRLYRSGR